MSADEPKDKVHSRTAEQTALDEHSYEMVRFALSENRTHLRHVESERRWFFGAFAGILAGGLILLSRQEGPILSAVVYGGLTIVSLFGLLFSLRDRAIQRNLERRTQEIATWVSKSLCDEQLRPWLAPAGEDAGFRSIQKRNLFTALYFIGCAVFSGAPVNSIRLALQ